LQLLKDIYPQYADDVDFYAVGVPFLNNREISDFEDFRVKRGYPWPVAVPQGDLLRDLNVTIQSTKVAFDSEGIIVHRAGMGKGSPEIWHQVLTDLSASRPQ
jgi:hypothetical protein